MGLVAGCGATARTEHGGGAPAIATEASAEPRDCALFVSCASGMFDELMGTTGHGARLEGACADAVTRLAAAQPDGTCTTLSVDEVDVAEIATSTPSDAAAGAGSCSVVVAHPTSPPRRATGTGWTMLEALTQARSAACAGSGGCTDAEGYRAEVITRRSARVLAPMGERWQRTVEIELSAVTRTRGEATSQTSRLGACRAAYAAACGANGCSAEDVIDAVDGVPIELDEALARAAILLQPPVE